MSTVRMQQVSRLSEGPDVNDRETEELSLLPEPDSADQVLLVAECLVGQQHVQDAPRGRSPAVGADPYDRHARQGATTAYELLRVA